MPKKKAPKTNIAKPTKKSKLPDDQPVHLDMSFEQAIKLAATAPKSKKKK